MIDPSLEDNSTDNPVERAGPFISETACISNKTKRNNEKAEQLQNNLKSHAQVMQGIHKKLVPNQLPLKALKIFQKTLIKTKSLRTNLVLSDNLIKQPAVSSKA